MAGDLKICAKHNKPNIYGYNSTLTNGCALCIIEKASDKRHSPKEKVKKTPLKSKVRKVKTKVIKIADADRIFSLFIRQRDADSNGVIRCISCGAFRLWRSADNGHYLKRQHMATRFNEINCNGQCKPCNGFEQGNNQNYRIGLVKKYSEKAVQELEAHEHDTCKLSQFDIEQIFNLYYLECKKRGFAVEVKKGKLIY